LEILLHHVLDEEVEMERSYRGSNGSTDRRQLLPTVLSFLQSATPVEVYLDILVQCIRKTELTSWRTLFAHLPPPEELFEQALKLSALKTAGGYLLVLQALDDDAQEDDEYAIEDSAIRLLRLASQKGDWELCGELARFLIALDGSGEMLRRAIISVGLRNGALSPLASTKPTANLQGLALQLPSPGPRSPSFVSAHGRGGRGENAGAGEIDTAGTPASTLPQTIDAEVVAESLDRERGLEE
jgi:hypothetical protein